ncbi:hypothetical protein KYI11_00215 [Macrococcoides bohemicum]|uniref:DUF697 domain-containing protein n=1 Tax=Macrococcoides bohemicum TaxID=1903056 RepID=A0AAE7QC35_9STAP|nr:hypothetical protein [Macrococcus bohemicus]QRN48621.1 hypothetical protein HT586_00215 [Macrococcus bohemicus]QYA42418.1 hypothetical protein KYI11_00215 [Macrococcus bohemicus]
MKITNQKDLDKAKKAAMRIVKQRATTSGAIAAVPVPGVDVAADIGLIMEVVDKINKKFGLSNDQIDDLDAAEKQKILVIVTSVGNQFIGKNLTKELVMKVLKTMGFKKLRDKQIAKFVPVIGAVVSGGISYSAMYALGKRHVDECYMVCQEMIESEKADT